MIFDLRILSLLSYLYSLLSKYQLALQSGRWYDGSAETDSGLVRTLADLVRSNSSSSFLTFLTSPFCIRAAQPQDPAGHCRRRGPVRSTMRKKRRFLFEIAKHSIAIASGCWYNASRKEAFRLCFPERCFLWRITMRYKKLFVLLLALALLCGSLSGCASERQTARQSRPFRSPTRLAEPSTSLKRSRAWPPAVRSRRCFWRPSRPNI